MTKAEMIEASALAEKCAEDVIDCYLPNGTPGFSDGDIFVVAGGRQKYRARLLPLRTREPAPWNSYQARGA
jgi:hypothetical protein